MLEIEWLQYGLLEIELLEFWLLEIEWLQYGLLEMFHVFSLNKKDIGHGVSLQTMEHLLKFEWKQTKWKEF